VKNPTTVERTSERELVVTRVFNGPARLVFEAWTKPELLKRWWAPKSFGITFISCEADVRAGGGYRFEFGHPDLEQTKVFFGRYTEVTPPFRLVWTNDEGAEGSVTTLPSCRPSSETKGAPRRTVELRQGRAPKGLALGSHLRCRL